MLTTDTYALAAITFARPWLLTLLVAVPLVAGLLLWLAAWRRGATRRLVGRSSVVRASQAARVVKGVLLLGGLAALVVAAARPQIGSRAVLLPREGTDVMIALDVSASMLATDIAPNRFTAAKSLISQVLDGLQGDRVGLTAFAGNAVLRFPLTTDIDAARELVNSTAIREGNLRPGTGIGDALRVSGGGFGTDGSRGKVIILISDGEDLVGGAVEGVRVPLDRDIRLYTVGLGTEEGSTLIVPDTRGGQSRPRLDPQTGQPAVSRANEALLRQIAQAGRGRFINGNNGDAAAQIRQEIATLQRSKFATQEGTQPIERYQWFLAAGIALLVLEMLIPERRRGARAVVPVRDAGRRRAA